MDAAKNESQKDSVMTAATACKRLRACAARMKQFFGQDRYVAKSEFLSELPEWETTVAYFTVLDSGGMLEDFCHKNRLSYKNATATIRCYQQFEAYIDRENEAFLQKKLREEKTYLDTILRECDPEIQLDEDQRRVVLTDEDYCLVIAGAGAGKTTTVAAKVKYLVDRQQVKPEQILVISFTNKAVNELKQRIIGQLHIPCPIATFHSTGNAILHKENPGKRKIADASKLYCCVRDYLCKTVLKNESMLNSLILFFASYFDVPYEGADLNLFFRFCANTRFSTMRSEIDDFQQKIIDIRTHKEVTIQNEVLRSAQEVEIANFLYRNGIDYDYEPVYPYGIRNSTKPYTPDFLLRQDGKTAYLEHFGITEDGKNNRYSTDQLEFYKRTVNEKILLHRKHGTELLYTFSAYRDGKSLTEHLQALLIAHGFVLRPRSNREIMEKLAASEENRYIRKLTALLCRFITNFKTNGFGEADFDRMEQSTPNVRSKLFLRICKDCYLEYQRILHENNAVDFEDMINESARLLREAADMKEKLNFRYIIVDEYQDISQQRFDLIRALRETTDAKIIAVGDDWQSIYAFSGSDITLFTHFAEKVGYAKFLKIVHTYRNAQEVIDIAGRFIQRNDAQIQKALISPKTVANPVLIYTYDSTRKNPNDGNRSGANYALSHAVETALGQILAYSKAEGRKTESNILLLGRYGFDGDMLERSGLFERNPHNEKIRSVRYPKMNLSFMTAHAAKGLGYDDVILLNGRNETYGFPSKIEDDPVLSFVLKGDASMEYAEERRLFYVAMTRTKNRVYCIAPEQNPSEFLLELRRDYKNVQLMGSWNEAPIGDGGKNRCPICGFPLQFRYKSGLGLRLYLCTNEPELCGFMTNDRKGGDLSILKCSQCTDGYLVVKPTRGDYFLGCTNYKKDGSGCNCTVSRFQYYAMAGQNRAEYIVSAGPESDHPAPSPRNALQEVPTPQRETKPDATQRRQADSSTLREPVSPDNPQDAAKTMLTCLSHISEQRFYSLTMLVDVLRGSTTAKLRRAGLQTVPEYGALSRYEREKVLVIADWLLQNGYMLQTKARYPVLHPTYEGMHRADRMSKRALAGLEKALQSVSVPDHPENG